MGSAYTPCLSSYMTYSILFSPPTSLLTSPARSDALAPILALLILRLKIIFIIFWQFLAPAVKRPGAKIGTVVSAEPDETAASGDWKVWQYGVLLE
jgi:hypothetical protein